MKKVILISLLALTVGVLNAQSWQEIFPDTLLQNYICEALENNSDVRIAQLSLEQSEAMLKAAKLGYLPSLSVSPSATVSKAQSSSTTFTYDLPITMTWELNLGGKQHFQKEIVKAQMFQEMELLKYTQIQLIADVANTYYTLVMLDRQYAVTQQGIQVQEENLRALQALKEVGQQNEAAVNQADANLQNIRASLPMLKAQIQKTESALCLLLNRQPDSIARASWDDVQSVIMDAEQSVPLETLSSRPDVLAAEYGLRASFNNVKVARSEFYPTFTISGSAGWTNNLGEVINPAKLLLNVIGTLVQPLFSMGKLKANLKVAQAQQEQAKITFEKALLTAGGEVRDALAECLACQQREEARSLQVEASKKAYENSKINMHYANTTYLEVLIAQSAWLDAQLLQTTDWLEKQQSFINLYKSICPE
ncbi:MAG: TolC family protein [Bacteroidales bacterium]|nr:TolC family protein [Bacteroidales bacterium]